MGNHHSRKRAEKQEQKGFGPTVEALGRVEGEEPPDSYDKLLAWMVEMAENDEVGLDSNTFVEHLSNVYAEKQRRSISLAASRQASRDSSYSSRFSKSFNSGEDLPASGPLRQTSFDSSCSSRLSKSPRSRDNFLSVPKQASLDSYSSRYSKGSRSPDELLSVPFRQASCESTGSSRASKSSRSREELLDPRTRFRRTMLNRQGTVDYSDDGDNTDANEASLGSSGNSSFEHEADNIDIADPRSVLLNSGYQETSFMKNQGPAPRSYDGGTYQGISNSVGDLLHGRVGFQNNINKKKSKSLMTMRRIMSETRNEDDIIPAITEENVSSILDDNLLDRNMADILYSVEALWPKVPK